jgi:hypothetical protein
VLRTFSTRALNRSECSSSRPVRITPGNHHPLNGAQSHSQRCPEESVPPSSQPLYLLNNKSAGAAPYIIATLLRKGKQTGYKVVSQMETAAKINLKGQSSRVYIRAEGRCDSQLLGNLHSTCHGLCWQPCWRHPHSRRHLSTYNGVSLSSIVEPH